MILSDEQVRWVAHLARLELTEVELTAYGGQLSSIMNYVDQLRAVPTEGVEPLSHALPLVNVLRDDIVAPSLSAAETLANAPARQGDYFTVPAVLE